MINSLTAQPQASGLCLDLGSIVHLDDHQLFALCQRNRDLRIERAASGELLMMSPTGGRTSDRNAEIIMQLRWWSRQDGTGRTFEAAGGFLLGDGAMRAPDAAWVQLSRLQELSDEEKERFLPLCPDFIIELRSPSDSLRPLQNKMQGYLDNGCRLAWLIDPGHQQVHVYRTGSDIEIHQRPATISGEPVLAGFSLDLAEIWQPSW